VENVSTETGRIKKYFDADMTEKISLPIYGIDTGNFGMAKSADRKRKPTSI